MQNKRKTQDNDLPSLEEAKALFAQLKDAVLQEDIERDTGIDQSQISRFIAGDFKRVGANAQKLCKYAKNVKAARKKPATSDLERQIAEHALKLWDRSEQSGDRVLALLQALHDFADR